MIVNQKSPLLIRLPVDAKAWLKMNANANNRSMTHEIIALLNKAMKAEPLEIYVHECQSPTGAFFTASIGKYGDDFYEGDDREAAFEAARAKAKELGLNSKYVRLNSENFNHQQKGTITMNGTNNTITISKGKFGDNELFIVHTSISAGAVPGHPVHSVYKTEEEALAAVEDITRRLAAKGITVTIDNQLHV